MSYVKLIPLDIGTPHRFVSGKITSDLIVALSRRESNTSDGNLRFIAGDNIKRVAAQIRDGWWYNPREEEKEIDKSITDR